MVKMHKSKIKSTKLDISVFGYMDIVQCSFYCVFIVNFEHISHLVLVSILLTLNSQMPTGWYEKDSLILLVFTGLEST